MINPQELLFSVDEQNNPIAPQPRALSHRTGIWHRSCHVWIVNSRKEILCQQRSLLKDSNPGRWEPFFGGHLAPGQEYADAAVIEVGEELGLQVDLHELQFFKIYKHDASTEFQGIFALKRDVSAAELQLEADEVQQVAWRSSKDIARLVVREQSEQWVSIGYEQELLDWLS